jgi:hypothetical protein
MVRELQEPRAEQKPYCSSFNFDYTFNIIMISNRKADKSDKSQFKLDKRHHVTLLLTILQHELISL